MNVDKLDMKILHLAKKLVDSDDTPQSAFAMGMNEGVQWLLGQPLVDRLTDEERDKLTPSNRYVLESIFGKGIFAN